MAGSQVQSGQREQSTSDQDHPATPPLSDEAWDEKRGLLEQLYLVEDRDLKDIIEIMKGDGFLATRKQYLRHFKRWHIEKNIKTHEYRAMVRIQNRRLAEGKQTEFRVRKRPVPRDKISRFLRKYNDRLSRDDSPYADEPTTPPDIEYSSPPLSPATLPHTSAAVGKGSHPVLPPNMAPFGQFCSAKQPSTRAVFPQKDISSLSLGLNLNPPPLKLGSPISTSQAFALPERIMISIQSYYEIRFGSGHWVFNPSLGKVLDRTRLPRNPFAVFDFIHLMEEVSAELKGGQATPETFRLLNVAFSIVKSILIDEDPQALHNLLLFYLELCECSTSFSDLRGSFVTYCAELASTVLGQTHPFATIFRALCRMTVREGVDCVTQAYNYIQDQFITHTGLHDSNTISFELVTLRRVSRTPSVDNETRIKNMVSAMKELARSDDPRQKRLLWWVQWAIGEGYLQHPIDYGRAMQYLETIPDATLGPGVRLLWNLLTGQAALGLHEVARAVDLFSTAMALCQRNSEVLRVLGLLGRAYDMMGDTDAAEGVRIRVQAMIGNMEEAVARSSWAGSPTH
ncbi:hypothetical protein GQ53DRAFT_818227 [Thozetella sp. PMI_491]|nr:hypothetical protein GQ53DRAFT_818227 [Thozetella sp. PMI_491]